MRYVRIAELRPSIGSENNGDHIIQHYISRIMEELFPDRMAIAFPTRSWLSDENMANLARSEYAFVCGTNLLTSHMEKKPRQWCLNPLNVKNMNAVLLGVGWWQYQEEPDLYTKWLLKNALHNDILHSVRDSYTEKKLRSIGITNVLNTACPTMWNLTEEHCAKIPHEKAKTVVTTLTNYNKNMDKDAQLLQCLRESYETVYVWLQAIEDYDYLKDLNWLDKVSVIPPILSEYEKILCTDVDYVGTRLHGGIHALNYGKRSLILAVDNRAKEIAKDTNLPVVDREIEMDQLQGYIERERETYIMLPEKSILEWMKQFKNSRGGVTPLVDAAHGR